MDQKHKKYIGYILTVALIVLGLNSLFGGNPIALSGYDLLPILAILTPIYYFAVMHKHSA